MWGRRHEALAFRLLLIVTYYCPERISATAKSIFATPLMKYLTGGKNLIAKQIVFLTGGDKNLILPPVPSENGRRSRIYNKNNEILTTFLQKH